MIIYKITNKLNGKCYIGQTRKSLLKRWKAHQYPNGCRVLYRAVKKYGKTAFSLKILGSYKTQKELNQAEKEFILFYGCLAPKGYNLTTGGDQDYTVSEETRQRRSTALRGRKLSMAHKNKLSAAHKGKDNGCTGRKYSSETLLKMSESHMGIRPSVEQRQKLGRKGSRHHYFGKTRDEDTKEKISNSLKVYFKQKAKNG